jgi:hypothetical protein
MSLQSNETASGKTAHSTVMEPECATPTLGHDAKPVQSMSSISQPQLPLFSHVRLDVPVLFLLDL